MIKIPEWLKKIPPGLYTKKDFIKLTGMGRCIISLRLKQIGVKCKLVKQPGSPHAPVKMYLWPGADYYLKKESEEINGKKED